MVFQTQYCGAWWTVRCFYRTSNYFQACLWPLLSGKSTDSNASVLYHKPYNGSFSYASWSFHAFFKFARIFSFRSELWSHEDVISSQKLQCTKILHLNLKCTVSLGCVGDRNGTYTVEKMWRCRGSNPGPFTCKANALPLSYIPFTMLKWYFKIVYSFLVPTGCQKSKRNWIFLPLPPGLLYTV